MALLNEGISNLEDLEIKVFIDLIRRIGTFQASEKLDGSGLWLGRDPDGRLFTTKPGAKSKKFYSDDEYPYFAAMNGPRGAMAAIEKKESDIQSVLMPGDMIELEIIYGRQPNTISYGLDNKHFIAIIGSVGGTNDLKAQQLVSLLNNQEVSVKTIIVDSEDGENLDRKSITQKFRFIDVPKIDASKVTGLNVENSLKKLESYLESPSGVNNLSNFELLTVSLGSIPKEERVEAKEVKDRIASEVKTKFKTGIKRELLDKLVSKVKPALAASDLSGDEDVGVAGIVLRDPTTGEQVKLVDKDGMNTLNTFNFAVRNQISGNVRTLDDGAPLESRGGITGVMKIRIANVLGNPELAMGRSARQIFADNKGDSPTQTLKNVSKILNNTDFIGVKTKIQSVIAATIEELNAMLASFNKHKDDPQNSYRLKMKGGKSIGLSPETVKRTLLTFAETKRNLRELLNSIQDTKTFDNLIAVLYGRAAREAHETRDDDQIELTESIQLGSELLSEKRNYTDVARFKEVPDAWTMTNIYFATVMMAVLIHKADDTKGVKLLRDKQHFRLQSYSDHMSALNFWGLPFWHPTRPSIAKSLTKKVAAELKHLTSKVPDAWVKFLHMDLSFGRDVPIDWQDHYKTLKFTLQHSRGNNTDRLNNLLSDAFKYEELDHDTKIKFLPKLYFFAQQFVPTSPLLTRVRFIHNQVLGGDGVLPVPVTKGQEMKLLGEDGEIAAGPNAGPASASQASTASSTNAGSVSDVQTGIGGKKFQIIRRKRNPDAVATKKFAKPKDEE